jgi:large-conductance mechanosensitive channel
MSLLPNNMSDLPNQKTQFVDNLKKFIADNNIVGTAAGVSIALVTKDVIQSLVGDVIIPGIIFLLLKLNIQSVTKVLPGNETFQMINFIKEFISWLFVVIITFVFVKFAFEGLLGIDDTSNNSSQNQTQTQDKTTSQETINQTSPKEPFWGGMM